MSTILDVNPKHNIIIKGAKLHNLKNIDVVIPRNKLVVITGLSGNQAWLLIPFMLKANVAMWNPFLHMPGNF